MPDTLQLLKDRHARLQSMTPEERRQMAEAALAEDQAQQRTERERRLAGLSRPTERSEPNGRDAAPLPSEPKRKPKKPPTESQVAKIMRAARSLPQPFTKNALVVAAYREAPALFGLKGFPQYPDSNLVFSYLYGKDGLVSKAMIERVGAGVFRVRGNGE
jgi:hypothetical protein